MRRIQRAKDKEDVVKALTSGETPVFSEIWKLLLFAAIVGFSNKNQEPLSEVDSGKAMPQDYFRNATCWPGFLYMLALASLQDPNVLSGTEQSDDTRIRVFEEYANGGLSILRERLESSGYRLDGLLALLSKTTVQQTGSLSAITI